MSTSSFPITSGHTPQKRNIKQVPFVELFQGRVQGVISSGSEIRRVYVAFFEAGSGDFYCSTNNNRPCGGLSKSAGGPLPCKHLHQLLHAAVAQYGAPQVAQFLKLPGEPAQYQQASDLLRQMRQKPGAIKKTPANEVFSRFLAYLRYLELPADTRPLPEMAWFV